MKIYTDGAATMKKDKFGNYIREAGGWAFAVINDDGEIIYHTYGHEDATTNNAMELRAIFEAIVHSAKTMGLGSEDKPIAIYSDSAYCINTLTDWMFKWEKNGWTRGKKHEPVENLNIIKDLYDLITHFNVEFNKVIGHSNDVFNQFVDELAVKAKKG